MSSVAQASKDKRKTKAGSSDASQTDQGKMKGAIKKVKFVQPKLSGMCRYERYVWIKEVKQTH